MTDLKYDVLNLKNEELVDSKKDVIDSVNGYIDTAVEEGFEPLRSAFEDGEVSKALDYDEAVDLYHDYIDDGMQDEIADTISDVDKQSNEIDELENKIDEIQDIIYTISKDFEILNIEVSHKTISTYLTIKRSDDFIKKYEKYFDTSFNGNLKSNEISIRISDHNVGGNEFYDYSHSEYEWLV
ncbi:hypothetical protein [Companilactobacillus sp. HBUAS56275]|uniref:hypothetical protein n=1 Tax=Companilactobacillus sp. HBUAS56275 TaxID=3109364 RepID=UPI002FF03F77